MLRGLTLALFLLLGTTAALAGPVEDCISDSADPDRVIRGCTQLIQQKPSNEFQQVPSNKYNLHLAYACTARGLAYNKKNEFDRAISDFSTAIAVDPKSVRGYTGRGFTYLYKHLLDHAISDFSTVIALDPKNAFAYEGRGRAYEFKGEVRRAIADYTKAIELDPISPRAWDRMKRLRAST